MTLESLPTLDAASNASSALLATLGWLFVRRGRVRAHRACMLGALLCSLAFLGGYLVYHAHAGHTPFRGPAWFRPVYAFILLTHTVLAAVAAPLVLVTAWHGLRSRVETHRRLARWALPIWLYVSVTGVAIYLLLYHVFGRA